MKQRRWRSLCLVAVIALASGACGSGPSIRSFEHGTQDLSQYRTFAFHESAAADQDIVPKFIRAAIGREMQRRGYRQGGDAPDLLVNFHLQTEEKDTVSTSPAAYFGWREGYHWAADPVRDQEITTYTAGTLNVDIVIRARNELAWEGVAIGRIRKEALKNPKPAIDAVIAQIFERYPLPEQRASVP